MPDFIIPKSKNGIAARENGAVKISHIKPLPVQVTEIIKDFLNTAQNGYIILAMQDSCVVKIEKTEKFIITAKSRDTGYVKADRQPKNHQLQAKIISELQKIQYGQLIVRIENGQVEQIEKTEKKRVQEMNGLYGDGI